jgi:hypothetical protein
VHSAHSQCYEGREWALSAALKICLIKTKIALTLSSKKHVVFVVCVDKCSFMENPLKQKSFQRYFEMYFLFFKNNLA